MDFPKSVPGVGLVNGKFIDEDPLAATPGSLIPSVWGNAVTLELLAVIESEGFTPDEQDNTQLLAAIDKKVSESSVAFASQAEAEAGVDISKAMSPARVFQAIAKVVGQATETAFGWAKVATQAQVSAGTNDATIVTPKKLGAWFSATVGQATEELAGLAKIATAAQVSAGTDDATIVTPKKLVALDPWALQPIGVPIGLFTDIALDSVPPSNKSYRYISLSADDGYNAGVLTGETVTGTGPLLEATAVINLSGSPLNGKTVRLINTERRVLRAGLSGTVQGDQFQGFVFASPDNQPLAYHNSGTSVPSTGTNPGRESAFRTPDGSVWRAAIAVDDGTNGAPRIGTETRSKNIGVTIFLRIK